jgi:hypothetical protein
MAAEPGYQGIHQTYFNPFSASSVFLSSPLSREKVLLACHNSKYRSFRGSFQINLAGLAPGKLDAKLGIGEEGENIPTVRHTSDRAEASHLTGVKHSKEQKVD